MSNPIPRTIPAQLSEQGENTPNLNDVLWALHDQIGRMDAMYKDLRAGRKVPRLLVDIRRSAANVSTLALSLPSGGSALPIGALVRIDNLIYTSSVAASLAIGDGRVIAVSASVPAPSYAGIIIYPQDAIVLTSSAGPGNMYLELTGEVLPPDELVKIIR